MTFLLNLEYLDFIKYAFTESVFNIKFFVKPCEGTLILYIFFDSFIY